MPMMQTITSILNDMRKTEVAEYILLVALAVVSPWGWEPALYTFLFFIATIVIRIVSSKHIGNPSLTKPMRWSLFMMAGYFLWNVASLLWSDNIPNGWGYIYRRLPLMLLPLLLLCNDTSYITPLRRRGVLYAYTLSLVIKFFYCIISALVNGKGVHLGVNIDPMHHTYMALHLMMALGFIYSEWFHHHNELHLYVKIGIISAAIIIVTYFAFVASRTGYIGLATIYICIVLHKMVRQRDIKRGLLILLGGLALATAAHYLMPDSARRMTTTISKIQDTTGGDIRIGIYSNAFRAGIDEQPLGAGVGDGQSILEEYYEEDGHTWPGLNTHNIFLDSLLSLGFPGLLFLIALFALPTIDGYRRRDFELMTLMMSIVIGGMFESVLSRQMGLMFIAPMWYAIASSAPCPQTDSTDSQ